MASLAEPYAELRAIKSICDGSEDVRNYLLARLNKDHFSDLGYLGTWTRIDTLVRNGKSVPEIATLHLDPVLPDDERDSLVNDGIEAVPSTSEAENVLDILEEFRKQRALWFGIREALEAQRDAEKYTESNEIVSKLDELLVKVRETSVNDTPVIYVGSKESEDLVDELLSDEAPKKIPTGFKTFDSAAGGFSPKNVITLAANTGGGKTVMAIQMSKNMAETGYRVGLVGFEMDDLEYYGRMYSCATGADHSRVDLRKLSHSEKVNSRKAWEEFKKRVADSGGAHGLLTPEGDMDPRQIEFKMRSDGIDVLLIDYIGLVSGYEKKQREERLSDLTRDFKLLANKMGCVVVLLAQMDEESQQVKYSKAIRHHSSFVWKWFFLHDADIPPEEQFIYVQQEKARNTVPFNFWLKADLDVMQIRDPDPDNNPNSREAPEYEPQQQHAPDKPKRQKQESDSPKGGAPKKTRRKYDMSKFNKSKKKRRLQDLQPDKDLPMEMDDL